MVSKLDGLSSYVAARKIRLSAAAPDTAQEMIDLRGWSARDAVLWLRAHDSEARLEGAGAVVSQSVAPGDPIEAIVRLVCR